MKACCNNCRWNACPLRANVDPLTYVCDDWEHYSQQVPIEVVTESESEPEHGAERNQHIETHQVETLLRVAGNRTIILSYPGLEQSVSDRYCRVCHQWVKATGIIGALLCQVCYTPWR